MDRHCRTAQLVCIPLQDNWEALVTSWLYVCQLLVQFEISRQECYANVAMRSQAKSYTSVEVYSKHNKRMSLSMTRAVEWLSEASKLWATVDGNEMFCKRCMHCNDHEMPHALCTMQQQSVVVEAGNLQACKKEKLEKKSCSACLSAGSWSVALLWTGTNQQVVTKQMLAVYMADVSYQF